MASWNWIVKKTHYAIDYERKDQRKIVPLPSIEEMVNSDVASMNSVREGKARLPYASTFLSFINIDQGS